MLYTYMLLWRWEKHPRLVKPLEKVPKDSKVPMIGHRFGHQSIQDESSGQNSTSFSNVLCLSGCATNAHTKHIAIARTLY